MKSFGDWFGQEIKPIECIAPSVIEAHECLVEDDGTIATEYPCQVCEEYCEIWCEPHEFDPDMHYCGGSPRCCP